MSAGELALKRCRFLFHISSTHRGEEKVRGDCSRTPTFQSEQGVYSAMENVAAPACRHAQMRLPVRQGALALQRKGIPDAPRHHVGEQVNVGAEQALYATRYSQSERVVTIKYIYKIQNIRGHVNICV